MCVCVYVCVYIEVLASGQEEGVRVRFRRSMGVVHGCIGILSGCGSGEGVGSGGQGWLHHP